MLIARLARPDRAEQADGNGGIVPAKQVEAFVPQKGFSIESIGMAQAQISCLVILVRQFHRKHPRQTIDQDQTPRLDLRLNDGLRGVADGQYRDAPAPV